LISVFGRDGEEIGKLHGYHGRGLYPADLWPSAGLIADRVGLWIDEEAGVPVLARIDAGLVDGAGSAQVGAVKLVPDTWPAPAGEALAQIGDDIEILAAEITPELARPGQEVAVHVQWRAVDEVAQALTTLVHVGQPNQPPLDVGDRPPIAGDYPTSSWQAGEVIEDTYILRLPEALQPGLIPIWIGMYDSQTITRLPVRVAGEIQPLDVFLAGWVDVQE
jgi:hypothetical protein